MGTLSKEQAEHISQLCSSVYKQGSHWVFQERDFERGTLRLTRGLTESRAKRKLQSWRQEQVERLLRSNDQATAYTLRVWKENPSWGGAGIWQWFQKYWYTTEGAAKKALGELQGQSLEAGQERHYEIHTMELAQLPGHFTVFS